LIPRPTDMLTVSARAFETLPRSTTSRRTIPHHNNSLRYVT
jgi:hypothetical protein